MTATEQKPDAQRLRARIEELAAAGSTDEALHCLDELANRGELELALELTALAAFAELPEAARRRASLALHLGRHDDAIAAADVAIAALLHDGLSVADFIELSLRGAQSEGLLRVERAVGARLPKLQEPIAVRWEALRRAGRGDEARKLRAVCLHHFKDRASVWASAGNQALDDDEPTRAEGYFDRCLELDPSWTAGLAGKAIVLEMRKDWPAALALRERVVQQERALERNDPPSVQRVIRFAAALARVGRWAESGALLRHCVALRAFERLPAERPVLLRVFSRELYSPAVTATLFSQVPAAFSSVPPEVALALQQAQSLGRIFAALQARTALERPTRLLLLGMCAWLAGDEARAYALLDEAEVDLEGDVVTQHLLACSAAILRVRELPSIVGFALQAARAALARAAQDEPVGDEEYLYAVITLARFDAKGAAEVAALGPPKDAGSCAAWYADALASAGKPCPPPVQPAADTDALAQLRSLVAFRAAQLAAGRPALELAAACAPAIDALAARIGEAPQGSAVL